MKLNIINNTATKNKILSVTSVSIISTLFTSFAYADAAEGQKWLSSQVQAPNSNIANNLQTKQEISQTLKLLQAQPTFTDLTSLLAIESSSEGLVRIALLAYSQDETLHPAWQKLINNQNADGGFGHIQDWQSNPLDTAFILIALSETNYLASLDSNSRQTWQSRINKALSYLATQQHKDGAYKTSHLDDLYTSSYVLSAFTPYVNTQGQYITNVQKLVNYLESKQAAPATWSSQANNKGLFLDALVAESLYPYQDSNNSNAFRTNFSNRTLALQANDGSWQSDAYVTSLVLRSLNKLSQSVTNPITSAISLSVIDTETSLALSGVTLIANNTDSAQSINLSSDSSGNVVAKDVAAGNYVFTLSKDGYASVQFTLRLRKGEQINLGRVKLSRAAAVSNGQIQGTITDKLLNNPIAGATVTVILIGADGKKLDNFTPIVALTNNEGAYQIVLTKEQQQASKGRFGIDIRTNGYAPIQGSGTAPVGGVVLFSPNLTLSTQSQAILTAQVIDHNGLPLSGVVFASKNNSKAATTDNSGKITINSLETGSQVWILKKEGYQDASLSFVVEEANTYDAGIITLAKIALTNPDDPNSDPLPVKIGTFSIAPKDATTTQNIQGFKVIAERLDKNNTIIQTQSFIPDDKQSTADKLDIELPIGKWRLTVSHPAYKPSSQSFDLTDTQQIDYTPNLTINPYALSGSVVDSQTNQPITNAPVIVFNNDTEQTLYNGKTDSNGNFTLPSNLNASNVRIEINPALYLPTTRYVSRQAESATNINLGEIRLRPKSADVVLPDLVISALDSKGLSTDQQRLMTTGKLKATIENKGNADLFTKDVAITAFIDANNNRQLDEGEQVVGSSNMSTSLAQGATEEIDIDISGKVDFRDAPIAVVIDSDKQIAEKNEDNNFRLTSDGVEIKPTQGTLEAEEVWHWDDKSNDSRIMTPIVAAPLEDTNKDGMIGKGDVATIIAGSYYGKIVAVNGSNGVLKWKFQIPNASSLGEYLFSPAIADIDNDGIPEIFVVGNNTIFVLDNEGKVKEEISLPINNSNWKEPSILNIDDMNGDGYPELLMNRVVYDTYTKTVNTFPDNIILAVDIDNDGKKEILTSKGVYNQEKELLFSFNRRVSYAAIAKVNNEIRIITTGGGYLSSYDESGKLQFSLQVSGGGNLGAPTIGDFDGDGLFDIAVAGNSKYSAFRNDGSVIWTAASYDNSSSTGSTVFDFNNDGLSEVLYFDERSFRIFDAKNGKVISEIKNSHGTAYEYPIVIDADADSHADIIIPANRLVSQGNVQDGIRMFSSKNKDWANTRNIWNQHNYRVTNINDDLSVPKIEPNSWDIHNTYRANIIPGVNVTAASDLTASYIQINDKGVYASSRFTARIGNAGGKPVAKGTPVSFYRLPKNADSTQAELIGKAILTDTLAGGDYVDLSIDYAPANGSLADFGELIVIANDAGAGIDSATGIPNPTDPADPVSSQGVVQEYTRSNNIARIAVTGDFTAFSLAGNVDKSSYSANDTVTIMATPTNLGSFPTSPSIRVSIIDSAGNTIQQFTDSKVDLGVALTNIGNPPVNSANVLNAWQTNQNRTGNYTAHIELIYQDKVVAQLDRPFAIVADGELSAQTNSQLYVDKTQYLATDLVQIHSRLINTASNAMAGQRDVTLTVADPSGTIIWTQPYSYDELAPNDIKDQYFTLPLAEAMVGNYIVTSTVIASDGNQAEQILTQSFKVLSAAQSGFGIAGTLTSVPEVNVGDTVNWQWSINNLSKEQLKDLPLSIALFKGEDSEPFKVLSLSSVNLSASGSLSGNSPWISAGENGQRITAVLLAEFAQGQKGLAQSQVMLAEPPISIIIDNKEQLDDTLLVYYSCVPGWHTATQNFSLGVFENECFDQREAILKRYLDRINVPYKLVKRPEQFAHEMQSGKYAQYWLLGAIEQLRPHTRKELIELTYSGDNLLMDSGMNSWLNQNLYPLAGAKHQGRLLLNTDMLALADQFIVRSDDNQIADTPLKITNRSQAGNPFVSSWSQWLAPIDPNKTEVWATVNGQPKRITPLAQKREQNKDYPAILSQRYGNGMPVATNFDVISSLDLATTANLPPYPNKKSSTNAQELHWDSILTQLIGSRRQTAKIDYVPKEVVRLPVAFANSSNQNKHILVSIDLPSGSQWLGYKGGVDEVLKNDKSVNYQITVKAGQATNDVLTLHLPSNAGTHPIRLTVSDVSNGTDNSVLLEQFETRYIVRDIETRIKLLQDTIDNWSLWSKNGHLKINAKTQINLIHLHRKTGARQLAVYEVARLGDTLSLLQKDDASNELQQLRYELDELLRALQIDWYIARNGYIPPV